MKIPWDPVTSGAGSFGPSQPTKAFMNYYSTPGGEVSHKAFQNLPMNTEAPPVIVPAKGAKHGSKVRDLPTGVGYTDRFTAHPIPGNYVEIIAKLDTLRKENKRQIEADRDNYPTLLSLVEQGYRNLGRNMDTEAQNSIRDRLRQAGASDEEIEIIMKEGRMEQLKKASAIQETNEQLFMRKLLRGVKPSATAQATHDANVYNFPNVAPLVAHLDNRVALPGNKIFAGSVRGGVDPAGLPRGGASTLASDPRSMRTRTAEREAIATRALAGGRFIAPRTRFEREVAEVTPFEIATGRITQEERETMATIQLQTAGLGRILQARRRGRGGMGGGAGAAMGAGGRR